KVILCGLPTATVDGLRHYVTPQIKGDILFIHGEADDVTLLSDMIEWAKPQRHLVTILPGANHFFTGYLKQLRIAMSRFLALSRSKKTSSNDEVFLFRNKIFSMNFITYSPIFRFL